MASAALTGIGLRLDEQVFEQRIKFVVQLLRGRRFCPRQRRSTMWLTSRGMTLEATLTTPCAPTAMNGSVSESSPLRIVNFGPSAARSWLTRSALPPASLMPTMF